MKKEIQEVEDEIESIANANLDTENQGDNDNDITSLRARLSKLQSQLAKIEKEKVYPEAPETTDYVGCYCRLDAAFDVSTYSFVIKHCIVVHRPENHSVVREKTRRPLKCD